MSNPYRELMTGKDGKLSFTKHLILLVFCAFVLKRPLPPDVAITLIVASHGMKALYAWKHGGPLP